MTSPTRRSLLTLTFAAMSTLLLVPVSSSAQNRIAQVVSGSSSRVALQNTVSPRTHAAIDLGPAPASTQLTAVTLRFNMTDAQSAALDALLAAQQNPSSPLYHRWLAPEQYATEFGLSSADIAKVTGWLQSQGLTVTGVARGHSFVTASGTVAQVQNAFGTTIHSISINGEQHIANLTEPTLPASIAAVTSTVTGLSDLRLKPHVHAHFTSSLSGNHYVAPGDFYTIYDINPLLTNSINGSGITIAVAGQTDISLTDVAAFRSASGLTANAPTVKLIGSDPGVPSTDDLLEASLDVEWSGAVAPSASILYVNSTDVIAGSLTQIIDQNLAPIATVSYGDCENSFGSNNIATYNQLFRQAAAQGQTIAGPAGDSGATDCDYQTPTATQGLAVDFPASSPYVTGVGGTQFNEGTAAYWNTTNGNYMGSAISYIPEAVWNETAADTLAANGVAQNISSGGGGASLYFTKPSWQVGTGVPSDFSRDVPDLAFNASASHDGYLFCAQGFCTNGYRNAASNLDVVGGTSVSTPAFAGMLALLEQKLQTKVGLANPTIYALANSTFYTGVFHDVTVGNNASPCTVGTPNCPNGGTIGYNATVGYDLASGWGSLDVFNFINDWTSVSPLASGTNGINISATNLTGSSTSVTSGTSVTLSANVTSATSGVTTVPTGTVQLLVDNVATGSAVTLSGSGTASFTYSTASLTSGAHVFTTAYSGDNLYAGSKGLFNLDIVSAASADFALTPSTSTVSTTPGGTTPGLSFSVTPSNGFVGNITFSASTTSSTLAASYSFSIDPVSITSTAAGTTVFTLTASQSNAQTTSGLLKLGIHSASTHAPDLLHSGPRGWTIPGAGVALAGLLFIVMPKRRSRCTALLLAVVSLGIFGVSGCSTGSSSTTTVSSTTLATAGTYSIVVTATGVNASGATLSHNANVTFVVQ